MHQEKTKPRHTPMFVREACENRRNHRRTENPVQQQVMIMLIIIEVFPALKQLPGKISDDSRAIQVGQDSAQCDQTAVTKVVRGFRGNQPTGEEMGDRRHESRNFRQAVPGTQRHSARCTDTCHYSEQLEIETLYHFLQQLARCLAAESLAHLFSKAM